MQDMLPMHGLTHENARTAATVFRHRHNPPDTIPPMEPLQTRNRRDYEIFAHKPNHTISTGRNKKPYNSLIITDIGF